MLGALARFGGLGHMRWPNLEGSAFGLAQLFLFFFLFFSNAPVTGTTAESFQVSVIVESQTPSLSSSIFSPTKTRVVTLCTTSV